jgi:membrane-associated phospholipid phosphatase
MRDVNTAIARSLSILLHPFVMIGLLVGTAAASREPGGGALRSVALVVAFTILPLAFLMMRQVRRGVWGNADASNAADRPVVFLVGGVALTALLAYIMVREPASFMVRGIVITLSMLALCALITRWIKVSLHMAFATFVAAALALGRSPLGYMLLAALVPLAWSRLALGRHTPGEITVGIGVGILAGAAIHYP